MARRPPDGSSCTAAASASPMAVPPLGCGRRLKASRTASRSSVSGPRGNACVLNATRPIRVPSATPLMNVSAASRDASDRVGATSVDAIEPEVSMHSTIAASCTATVARMAGRASARPAASSASAQRAAKIAVHGGARPIVRSRNARSEYTRCRRAARCGVHSSQRVHATNAKGHPGRQARETAAARTSSQAEDPLERGGSVGFIERADPPASARSNCGRESQRRARRLARR